MEAVVAVLEPKHAWATLQAMRPQQRTAALGCLSALDKARVASALDAGAAVKLVARLAPRDMAATLAALGKDAQAALLRSMDPDD
jgi:Mg/Co/Ni transporter MgtE